MKKYNLFVCMPCVKYHKIVKADTFTLFENRLNFYTNDELIASYPSQYTVIEKIEKK